MKCPKIAIKFLSQFPRPHSGVSKCLFYHIDSPEAKMYSITYPEANPHIEETGTNEGLLSLYVKVNILIEQIQK